MTDWAGSAFVFVTGNVPKTMIPPWVRILFVQLCSGTERSDQRPGQDWLNWARDSGYTLAAWHWCTGADPEAEAQYHATTTYDHGIQILCANMEQAYDAGGDPSSSRYQMPGRYLRALHWDGPLAVTTTPLFASHMGDWQNAGAVTMPQSFPTAREGGYEIPAVVRHHQAWGWPREQIRPLVQTYAGREGMRPDATVQNAQAAEMGVGVTPYTLEQSIGTPALDQLRNAIERPTPGKPAQPAQPATPDTGGDTMKIGPQDGVVAEYNMHRDDHPDKTLLVKGADGKWPDISTLTGTPLDKWKALDKAQRREAELVRKHDADEPG